MFTTKSMNVFPMNKGKKLEGILIEAIAKPMFEGVKDAIVYGDPDYLSSGLEEAAVNVINKAGEQVDVLCDVVDSFSNAFDRFAEGVDAIIDFFMGF